MQDEIESFVDAWSKLDPFGTSFIYVRQLTSLLESVCVRRCHIQRDARIVDSIIFVEG